MSNSTLVGQVLLNQFRVDSFVASGGMSVVYKVWDLQRSVYLAMKVLNADLADDPVVFRRFQHEANALMRLAHPNIVPFYGLYEAPTPTRGLSFLLEAFIGGPSLREVLGHRRNYRLPLRETLTYMKSLCAALGYAHAMGVIHCDVKPANVLVDHSGAIYLTDFGIARQLESSQTMTTALGQVGTPAYMAPEQITGSPLSPATDIYSLGVMLFEMLTGQRPFLGTEQSDTSPVSAQGELPEPTGDRAGTISDRVRYAHVHFSPPDPRANNPDLSPALAQVILKALAKDPSNRYASAGALYEALLNASGYRPETVPDRVAPLAQPADGPVPFAVPVSSPRSPAGFAWGRSCLLLAALVLLAAALVGGIGFIRMRSGQAGIPATGAAGEPLGSIAGVVPGTQTPGSSQAVSATLSSLAASQQQAAPTATAPASQPLTAPPAANPHPAAASTAAATAPVAPTAANNHTTAGSAGTGNATGGGATASDAPAPGSAQWVSPKDGMTLLPVPGGPFIMGSDSSPWKFESPQHTVTLDTFWIDKTEVTNAMFAKFIAATSYQTDAEKAGWSWVTNGIDYKQVNGADWRHPLGPDSNINGMDNYPVVQVSWNDANAYARWAGRRLPTEAEWEKAARGTDGRLYPWGSQIDCAHANYNPSSNNADHTCKGGLTPVDAYLDGASPYGVLDMTGNAWNWVADWYQSDFYAHAPGTNPTGPDTGTKKVHKGGAWYSFNLQVQPSYRFGNNPEWSYNSMSFRCALTP